jgi:hypothetical protein
MYFFCFQVMNYYQQRVPMQNDVGTTTGEQQGNNEQETTTHA